MKYFITILFVVFAIVAGFKDDEDWKSFKKNHKRSFKDDDEEKVRFDHFKRNDDKIKKHNEKFKNQEVFYEMGHNEFSDKSRDEISKMLPPMDQARSPRSLPVSPALPQAPAALSYQSYGLPIQNQGSCASCWAFAAAAQYEMQIRRKYPSYNTPISTQRLLDCATSTGCVTGGWPQNAFNYMYYNGFSSMASYPYLGFQQTCGNYSQNYQAMSTPPVSLYFNGNEQNYMNSLASTGPVVASMFSSPDTFVFYKSGVFWDTLCPNNCNIPKPTNHNVVVVGYGIDTTSYSVPVSYWLIRNSWGTGWGEYGYGKIIRNWTSLNNNCNIACNAYYSVV